jgi:AcrR family transcriptional regulator
LTVGPAQRHRNPRGQGQLLRAQIVEVTAHLVATLDHPETLTLRQVAREIGIAPASIYGHFDDLGALLDHVLELRYAELSRLLDRAGPVGVEPLTRLVGWCTTYVRWGVEHPGEYRTLFGGRIPAGDVAPAVHHAGSELLTTLSEVLADARDPSRELSDDEHRRAGILMWASMHGLVSVCIEHPGLELTRDLDDLLPHLVALHTARSTSEIATVAIAGRGLHE